MTEGKKYIYNPIGWDMFDPRVIEGYEIEAGAIVTVTKTKIDPLGKFVFVVDGNGNRQSVCKASLDKIKN